MKQIVRISITTLKIAGAIIVGFIVALLLIGFAFISMVAWQEGHYATAAFLTALVIASSIVLPLIAKKAGVDFIDFG